MKKRSLQITRFLRRLPSILIVAALSNISTSFVAIANPRALYAAAGDRLYISSEHLSISISTNVAELNGQFTFKYRQDVSFPGRKHSVILEIPIWFPDQSSSDNSVEQFWKIFPRDDVALLKDQNRSVFEKAVRLHASIGNDPLQVERFNTLTSTNSTQVWAPHEWQQTGFCCLLFSFPFRDDTELTQKPLTVTYRQPLIRSEDGQKFLYIPVFQNLPKEFSTANTNQYSIVVTARPGCSVVITNGDLISTVGGGHSTVLSPRHHQPIRAVVRSVLR